MISQKSKYALKALTVLAEEYGKGPILIADIATREHIPRSFLELILLELKNHRLLDAAKGAGAVTSSPSRRRKFRSARYCARSKARLLRYHARARPRIENATSAVTN